MILNGNEIVIEDEGRGNFDFVEKDTHSLRIHRTRVPLETEDTHAAEDKKIPFVGGEKTMHTQLDLAADITLNSSKAVITVRADVTSKDTFWMDAIFSCYSLTATGAKASNERKIFSSDGVKKKFKSHYVKSAIFPVCIFGLFFLIRGMFAIISAVKGTPSNIGGMTFTTPWAVGLTAVGAAFVGYGAFCLMKVLQVVKKFSIH